MNIVRAVDNRNYDVFSCDDDLYFEMTSPTTLSLKQYNPCSADIEIFRVEICDENLQPIKDINYKIDPKIVITFDLYDVMAFNEDNLFKVLDLYHSIIKKNSIGRLKQYIPYICENTIIINSDSMKIDIDDMEAITNPSMYDSIADIINTVRDLVVLLSIDANGTYDD